jgi:hypothetical protein
VDRISPPELNQQNVFCRGAERKLIAHSAPPVLFAGSNNGSGFSSNADEIAATKGLYRRHINPMREIILNGLQSVFDLINNEIVDFRTLRRRKYNYSRMMKLFFTTERHKPNGI